MIAHSVTVVSRSLLLVACIATGSRTASAQTADSLREDFRLRLAASVAGSSESRRSAELAAAQQVAEHYADALADSILLRQWNRFKRWPASARARKVAADSLRHAGFEAYPRQGPAAALGLWTKSRQLARVIDDSAGLAATLGNLGAGFLALGEPDSAARVLAESRLLADKVRDWHTLANTLDLLGSVSRYAGDLHEARRHYAAALAIRKRSSDERGAAADENNLGLIAAAIGDTAAARRWYSSALAGNRRGGWSAAAINLGNLAGLATGSGQLDEATALYREALAIHRKARDDAGAGVDLRNIGNVALRQGNYDDAIGALADAGAILVRTGPPGEAAGALADLAEARAAIGDLAGAHAELSRAELVARGADAAVQSIMAITMADLSVDAEAYGDAMSAYARAESLAVEAGDLTIATQAREGLGSMYLRRGEVGTAIRILSEAVRDLRDGGDRRAAALTALHLGAARAELGEVAAAQRILDRARRDLEAERDPVGEAAALAALAALAEQSRQTARAASLYRAGLDLIGSRSAPDVATTLWWGLGRTLHATGALAEAEQALRRAIDLGTTDARRLANAHGDLALVEQALGRDARAFETSEHLRHPHTGFRAIDLSRRLAPDEALLEYLVTDSITLVFAVTRQGVRAISVPVDRPAIRSAVDFSRAAITHHGKPGTGRPAWQPPLRRLHTLLIDPVAASGALDGIRKLIIVPHAELHYLPFAALMPASGGYLVERYTITYAPSAEAWLRLGARSRPSATASVLALAPFPGELPGSRDEARSIGWMNTDALVLVGSAATKSVFRAQAGEYDIIHLATYGVLNRRNPLYSYVALAPDASDTGRLEVREVQGLTLHARLLVLSACETGLASGRTADVPAGDDWVGLMQAFLTAGADNVLATLWPISDRETARLMPRLHEHLRTMEPAAALAALQRSIIHGSPAASPMHWASFVVAGSGR